MFIVSTAVTAQGLENVLNILFNVALDPSTHAFNTIPNEQQIGKLEPGVQIVVTGEYFRELAHEICIFYYVRRRVRVITQKCARVNFAHLLRPVFATTTPPTTTSAATSRRFV